MSKVTGPPASGPRKALKPQTSTASVNNTKLKKKARDGGVDKKRQLSGDSLAERMAKGRRQAKSKSGTTVAAAPNRQQKYQATALVTKTRPKPSAPPGPATKKPPPSVGHPPQPRADKALPKPSASSGSSKGRTVATSGHRISSTGRVTPAAGPRRRGGGGANKVMPKLKRTESEMERLEEEMDVEFQGLDLDVQDKIKEESKVLMDWVMNGRTDDIHRAKDILFT